MNARQRRKLARQQPLQQGEGGDTEKNSSPKSGGFGDASNGEQLPESVTTSQPEEGARAGHPTIFDDRLKGQVAGLVATGVSQRAAAQYVGVDHSTISKAIARDEEFAREMAKARATARINPLLTIVAASKKDWRAAALLLKRSRPEVDVTEDEEMQPGVNSSD